MKKLIYYLIFLLALIMMLLACSACRSQKTVTCSKATTDSVNLSVRDSTTQHFSFTFDSLVFSTTELTELTERLRAASVCSVSSVVNKNLPCSSVNSVCSVVNKNLPCSRLVVYGGKLSSNSIHSVSQDSTSSKKAQEVKNTRIRSMPNNSPIFIALSLVLIFGIIIFFKKRVLS